MKRVNICIGRFQPFTAGHYKCVEVAWNEKHIPTVVCMINVPENKVDKRHPFPTELLVDSYNELFSNDNKIADMVPVQSADIVTIGKTLRSYGYEIASWTCGTDRYETYSRMASKYHDQAGLTDDFELIEIQRTDDDVSATKMRECLLNNDKRGFYTMLPKSIASGKVILFNTLKDQIDYVYGNN